MAEDIAELGLYIDSSGVVRANKELKKLENQSEDNEKANEKLGGSFKSLSSKLGVAALAIAGATLAFKGISEATNQWRDFSSAISDLSAITGATGKDLDFLKKKALEIGQATTLSASQAATAFKLIASAKPDLLENANALAEVTKQTVLLAEASGLELTDAATSVGGALNQFGAGAEEAARFVNVLAAGAKFGASEINLTAMALNEAGTVAASAGLSFEETNAAIQQLAAVSIKGSKAGVALRNAIVNLRTRGVESTNPAIVGLSAALQNLGKEQLDTAELAKLFGKENLAAGEALLKTADNMDVLTAKLTGTNTAMEQATIKTDNLNGDIARMDSAWSALGITLGEILDPALRGTTQAITSLGSALNDALTDDTPKEKLAELNIEIEKTRSIINQMAEAGKVTGFFDVEEIQAQTEILKAQVAEAEKLKGITDSAKDESDVEEKATADLEKQQAALELKAEQQKVADALALNAVIDQEQLKNDAIAEGEHQQRMATAIHQLELEKLESDHQKAKKAILMSGLASAATLMQSGSEKLFKIGKAAAIAQSLINGYAAIVSSYKHGAEIGGPYVGAAFAAIAAVTTAAQIQDIRSQSFGGGGSPSASGGAGVSSLPDTGIQTPVIPEPLIDQETTQREPTITNIFLEGAVQSTESVIQLIESINELASDGMEVRATVLT